VVYIYFFYFITGSDNNSFNLLDIDHLKPDTLKKTNPIFPK
jgi:hypothetical protein